MTLRTAACLAVVCCFVALSPFAAADSTWYGSGEPPGVPVPSAPDYDGSPTNDRYEMYSMRIEDLGTGEFNVWIQTNFAPDHDIYEGSTKKLSKRTDTGYDSYIRNTWFSRDSFANQDVSAGELYIRVRWLPDDSDAHVDFGEVALYGFAMETHSSYADALLGHLGLTKYDTTEGTLYGGDVSFLSATYEQYAEKFEEVPDMLTTAAYLPGVLAEDTTKALRYKPSDVEDYNRYPTILVDSGGGITVDGTGTVTQTYKTFLGAKPSTSNQVWDPVNEVYVTSAPWKVEWQADFTLPGFDPDTMFVEVWWSMLCGNDAVEAHTYDGPIPASAIPIPGTLLLCGIGVGFAGVVRALRRRARRS